MHYLYYDKGILSDTNRIKTIPDNKFIAKQIKYLHPRDDLFIKNIESGTFAFNGGEAKYIICNTGEGSLDFFKKDYLTYNAFDYSLRNGKVIRKTAAEINALENLFKKHNNNSSPDKLASNYNATAIADYNREIESLYKRAMYALSYYRAANQEEKGYAGSKRAYQQS